MGRAIFDTEHASYHAVVLVREETPEDSVDKEKGSKEVLKRRHRDTNPLEIILYLWHVSTSYFGYMHERAYEIVLVVLPRV